MIVIALMLSGAALPFDRPQTEDAAPSSANMRQAEAACNARDFDSFLEAFIQSPDVRRRYTAVAAKAGPAGEKTGAGRMIPGARDQFEITMVDYYYADTASVRRWEADGTPYVPLWVDRVALPGGGWRVDYQPAIFRDDGVGDGQTFVRKTGRHRAYVFLPHRGCWRLVRQSR